MEFSGLVKRMDERLLAAFSEARAQLTIHFSDASPDIAISCIVKRPSLEEDYVPGSTQGASVLLVFVREEQAQGALRAVTHKDTATVNDVDYDIFQVDADREGGLTLRMRRRTQNWAL